MKNRKMALGLLTAIASVGFVMSASAADLQSHNLDSITVEGVATLPGGYQVQTSRLGILGNVAVQDVPFTQRNYSEKTIENFYDPNQAINGVLANNPSIRVGSASPMYTDFNMRGVNMNGTQYALNGVPSLFNQTRSLPMHVMESIDIVSGPMTVLNGSTFSNNGVNGTSAPVGLLNATTKKAPVDGVTRYTQRFSGGSTWTEQLDVGRRFGDNKSWGVRVNGMHSDGNLAIHNAKVKDKNVYINIDHQDEKSTTNIFGGYYDWGIDGGQRWLASSAVEKGHLPKATDLKTNLSFDEQFKYSMGSMFTFNHDQKLEHGWDMFINAGAAHYTEHKLDPNSGSWTLNNDGKLTGKLREYKLNSLAHYGQFGFKNSSEGKNWKNDASIAFDYMFYKTRTLNANSGSVTGDIWNGVTITGPFPNCGHITSAKYTRERARSITLADRLELGKLALLGAVSIRNTKYEAAGKDAIDKSSVNPSFAASYKLSDKLTTYAGYSESYTRPYQVSGGYANDGEIFEPIKNKQIEVGFKMKTQAMLHTLAFFDLNEGSYIREANPDGGADLYTRNGENRYKGIEYSFTGKVANKWNVNGGFLYLNGKREKLAKGSEALEGKFACGAPKWNGVLAFEYEADKNNSLIARMNAVGKSHVNDKGCMTPAFATVDLGYKHKTKLGSIPVTLNAMCYNILGKDYWISRGTSTALGSPRSCMLSASFDI